MASVTANGFDVLEGRIEEPVTGPWTARIELDLDVDRGEQPPAVGDPIRIEFEQGAATFIGTVTRGETVSGRWLGRVVGGADGFGTPLEPKYYSAATVATVLTDILRASGEQLDPSGSDAAVLGHKLGRWARAKGQARLAVSALMKETAAFWRVGRAGTLTVRRTDRFEPVEMPSAEVDRNPDQGRVTVAPEGAPYARPGTTLNGLRIASVVTTWTAGTLRQELLVAGNAGGVPRGAAAGFIDAVRRANEAANTYSQVYPAKVVKQDPVTGEVDVSLEDERLRGGGFTGVPLRHGIPGLQVKVKVGELVNVFFENGDPKRPAAALWPDGSSVLELAFDADVQMSMVAPVVNLGATHPTDSVPLTNLILAQLNVLKAAISSAPVAPMDGGAAFKAALVAALASWPGNIASVHVKAQ